MLIKKVYQNKMRQNKKTRDLAHSCLRNILLPRNCSAAMEMTIGIMVTLVLLIAVLIMVLFFISRITESGTSAIEGIDAAVKGEINKLFAKDSTKRIIIYPETREISIKKGESSLGFGFAIRNVEEEGSFSYDINANSVDPNCPLKLPEADLFIALGKRGNNILIPSASIMEEPIFVRFSIPENAPACKIRYAINVEKNGKIYGSSIDVDLNVKSA